VNQFLVDKVEKKLQYLVTSRLGPSGFEVIVNGVLVSTCLYFLAVWRGSNAGVKKVTGLIRNYFWSGSADRARAGVAWSACCLDRNAGGLNFINPSEAVVALMMKWIISAYEPGTSNFKALLRYRLSHCQPYGRGSWPVTMTWFHLPDHKGASGSPIWQRVIKSWKVMVTSIQVREPTTFEEWLATDFWWGAS
jgi:hypothetical protein